MASIPEDWQPAGYDEPIESAASSPSASPFWRYYWLMTVGAGLLGLGLLAAQANQGLSAILILGSLGLLIVGLIPCLVGTAERQVGAALAQRMPNHVLRWSDAAIVWWYTHWVLLLVIASLFISATMIQGRGITEFLVVLAVLLCVLYLIIIVIVLTWRWRRMRLAHLAGLEELQSFELVLESDEIFTDLALIHPIFSGKLKGRCPVLLRRNLGDWSILLFDWLDINKQPPRREWITVALIGLHHPLPMFSLQPTERVSNSQLHWWHIFLEFPFGLIIFLIGAATHFANKLKSKPPLAIAHTPGLTRGYQLDTTTIIELHKYLSPAVCQDMLNYIHKKKRFLMVNEDWLLLASHKKEIAPKQLGELVADALRLADILERAKHNASGSPLPPGERG